MIHWALSAGFSAAPPSPFILGVYVGSVLQQELNNGQTVVAGGEMQRRGLSTLQVSAVHVLHRAEFLQRERDADQWRQEHENKGGNRIYHHIWLWAGVSNSEKNLDCFQISSSGGFQQLSLSVTVPDQDSCCWQTLQTDIFSSLLLLWEIIFYFLFSTINHLSKSMWRAVLLQQPPLLCFQSLHQMLKLFRYGSISEVMRSGSQSEPDLIPSSS